MRVAVAVRRFVFSRRRGPCVGGDDPNGGTSEQEPADEEATEPVAEPDPADEADGDGVHVIVDP